MGTMDMTRRGVLGLGLGMGCFTAPTLAAIGEVPKRDAFVPWGAWERSDLSPMERIVLAATLAASAHNTQPWRFHIAPDRIALHLDPTRNVRALDPVFRETRISLGCALENMAIVARALGVAHRIEIAPGPVARTCPEPVAVLHLNGHMTPEPGLSAVIPRRHTNRGPYDTAQTVDLAPFTRAADDPAFAALNLTILTDPRQRTAFAAAIVAATEAIVADGPMIADSDAWFRDDDQAVARHRDGLTLACAGLSPFTEFLARLLPSLPPERVHRAWIDRTRDVQAAGPPLFGMIRADDPGDAAQALAAGRLWQRLHLTAVAQGLAAQPLNPLTEIADRRRALGQPPLPSPGEGSLVFAFRLGVPLRPVPPSPRRAPDVSA